MGEGGGHRWPFSLSGFSKGYSPGWALCLLLLSDTNSCHGWVWDGIRLWVRGPPAPHPGLCWCWDGWGCPTPPPAPSWGSHCAKSPPGLLSPASSLPGAAVTLALSSPARLGAQPGTCPSPFGAPGLFQTPPGSLTVRVWLGGGPGSVAACRGRGCSVPGRTSPPTSSFFCCFGKMNLALFSY